MHHNTHKYLIFLDYLEHSYRYYVLNNPVISDTEYDAMCKYLLDNYDDAVTWHPWHKVCGVTRDTLSAGTGYSLKYPSVFIDSLE